MDQNSPKDDRAPSRCKLKIDESIYSTAMRFCRGSLVLDPLPLTKNAPVECEACPKGAGAKSWVYYGFGSFLA